MTIQLMSEMLFSSVTVDPKSLMLKDPALKPYAYGYHEEGVKRHTTNHYKISIGGDMYLFWSICPDCKRIRTKKFIGFIQSDEEGQSTAVVNDVIKNEERMSVYE